MEAIALGSNATNFDVVIVAPPFATVMMPMIGPSILVAQCKAQGIKAQVEYSGIRLAKSIGLPLYEKIGLSSFSLMLGDLLFRDLAFPELAAAQSEIESYFLDNLHLKTSSKRFGHISRAEALYAYDAIAEFVHQESERILGLSPKVVGFSTTFQQNHSSIALAKELRRKYPSLMLVAGGANVAEPMGTEFLRVSECFDYTFSGEADIVFPRFVAGFLSTGQKHLLKSCVQCPPVDRLDEVGMPDFKDYFDQLAESNLGCLDAPEPGAQLPLETSRGCWWGAKHHCTFCGLNGADMAFRVKSPERVVSEIQNCQSMYNVRSFQATDNIMSNQFRASVLPLLEPLQPLDIFFEVKSNLKEKDLDQFVMSGVNTIQPGIESFSTSVLKKIAKGVTGIRNVWLLRECSSRRISVTWNLLVDVPDELEVDLTAQAELIPLIVHFQPPNGLSRIVIDRFSPYFDHPETYGINDLQPLKAYAALYPPNAQLSKLAYHFYGKYTSGYRRSDRARRCIKDAVENWRQLWQTRSVPPKLYGVELEGGRMFIEDTRWSDQGCRFSLSRTEAEFLRSFCYPRQTREEEQGECLLELLGRGLLIQLDGMVMSVVAEPGIGFALQLKRLQATDALLRKTADV